MGPRGPEQSELSKSKFKCKISFFEKIKFVFLEVGARTAPSWSQDGPRCFQVVHKMGPEGVEISERRKSKFRYARSLIF